MMGLSTSGSISFGCALVAGKNRVPRPAAGNTALRTFMVIDTRQSRIVPRQRFAFNRTLYLAMINPKAFIPEAFVGRWRNRLLMPLRRWPVAPKLRAAFAKPLPEP